MLKQQSVWRRKVLYDYEPMSAPELKFWYAPLSGENQILFRQQHSEFDSTYDLMEWLFRKRLVMFEMPSSKIDGKRIFVWPENPEHQNALFEHIPKSTVIETGAAILGWKRNNEEDASSFVNRIVQDLKSAMEI